MPEMAQRASLLPSTSNATNGQLNHPPATTATPSSIPPWVHLNRNADARTPLPSEPRSSRPNTRHYKPPPSHYKPGRKWDHYRSAEPPLLSAPIDTHQMRWSPFMASGPNHNEDRQDGSRVVSQAWMDEHMPYLSPGWEEDDYHHTAAPMNGIGKGLMYGGRWLISPERQEKTVRLFWRLLLKNPFIPLAFRLTILAFSAASLGIASSIFVAVQRVNNDSNPNNQCATQASTTMAICVGAVAIPYVGYVTWDEYMSKPLGLRSVAAKILLLLCDLYFIVFAAANVSLAFGALLDHGWACYDERFAFVGNVDQPVPATCPDNPGICTHQKALSGVLLVGLLAWLITFSLSVMRVVEKLRPD